MHFFKTVKTICSIGFSLGLFTQAFAQKSNFEVRRCGGMDRTLPVQNVTVDANNRKWAANRSGVFQMKSPNDAVPRIMPPDELCVLSYAGGNVDYAWSETAFKRLTKADPEITAAWYDSKTYTLTIGSKSNGLYWFKTNGALQLAEKMVEGSSKLPSNHVNIILLDKSNRYWIGTAAGVMFGTAGKWRSDFTNYDVRRIREYGSEIFVLADGVIYKSGNGGEKWFEVELEDRLHEGEIRDFDIDKDGKIWAVSGIVAQYDPLNGTGKVFGGPENYTSLYGFRIAVDADGAAWVGTEDKGLYNIDKADALHVDAVLEKGISCSGNGNDAEISVRIQGGTGPYSYAWSGNLFGDHPSNVPVGNYDLTVTDSKGNSRSIQVVVPDTRMRLTTKAKKAASGPEKADGAAEVDVAGNVSGIMVQWDNGESLVQAVKLTSGEHTVTVTNQKGCSATAKVVIKENILPMSAAIKEKIPLKCSGDKNAALTVLVNGGKKPFQYKWSNPALKGEEALDVGAGKYAVTVTDATGTTAEAELDLRSLPPLNVTVDVQSSPSPGAADGRAIATVEGGSAPYFFEWGSSGETTQNATLLPAGEQVLKVKDSNNCLSLAKFTLLENIPPLSVSISFKTSIRCRGDKNVALTVKFQGGKKPFTYRWNDVAITEEQPTNLGAGFYQVTVTDAAGSTAVANITIVEPEFLTLEAQALAPASTGNADGKAVAKAKGGNGEYFYRWDNQESGPNASKLSPGKHTVVVNDANGCDTKATVEIGENILPLSAKIEEKGAIKCAGDKSSALEVSISGGKSPFQYKWSNPALNGGQPTGIAAGEYQLTITDATGGTATTSVLVKQPDAINVSVIVQSPASTGNSDGKAAATAKGGRAPYVIKWDNGENVAVANTLSPGKHSVTVTDANGCSATASVDISENILPLSVKIEEKTAVKCAGDKSAAIEATVSGGKGPYQYKWSNPAFTGTQASNLAAGEYVVTVTDAVGGKATTTFVVNQPSPLEFTAQIISPATLGKNDGKATITAKGGKSPYTFKWDNGEISAAGGQLPAGKRTVTITDANGCSTVASLDIAEKVLPLNVRVEEKGRIKCAGEKSAFESFITGGKGPFQYKWSNPTLSGAQPTNVPPGDYQLTVVDAMGAEALAIISVKQPEPLSVETSVLAPASTGNADGKAQAAIKGGQAPHTIKWDNGEATANAMKLGPGVRSVTVTDANGCSVTSTVNIGENVQALTVKIVEKSSIKCYGDKASFSVQVSGGKAPFAYAWNNPALQGDKGEDLDAGTYIVTVTDAKGSSQTATLSYPAPEQITMEIVSTLGAINETSNDGRATISVKGGVLPHNILWDNRQTGPTVNKLPLGPRNVTITDAKGCVLKVVVPIEKRILPELTGAIENGQTIRMRLLNFDTDKSDIKPESFPVLDELHDFMVRNSGMVIEIGGHTNNLPSDDFAEKLSSARAKAVVDYLKEKGIEQDRLQYKGYGKRYPIASNLNPEGRKANQRVEIKIIKIK